MRSEMSAEESIKVSSMFDGRSHHGSFREHLWHRWRVWMLLRRFACLAMVCIGGYFAMKSYGGGSKFHNFITISFILIGSVGFMRPMIWQMWSERKLRKHPAFNSKIHYEFNPKEVIMNGSSGRANVPWSEFFEIIETKKGLLMYQNKKDYLWIPAVDFKTKEMSQIVIFHQTNNNT